MWLNGNISDEGLTADLEAMHEIGIGGAIVLHLGNGSPGPVRFLSPEFQKLITHLLSEADRLGLQIDFNNDDGWDAAGPWVTPEHGMQMLAWTETHIVGGTSFSATLPQPKTIRNFYRDIAVFAMPAPLCSNIALPAPSLTETPGLPSIIIHDYGRPVEVRSAYVNLSVDPTIQTMPVTFSLECSDDGTNFRNVYLFENHWRFAHSQNNRTVPVTVRFVPVQARYFRLVLPFTKELKHPKARDGKPLPNLENSFQLSAEDQILLWEYKAGHITPRASLEKPDRYPGGYQNLFEEANGIPQPAIDPRSVIASSSILDLTKQCDNGHLNWTAPPGEWIVTRLGYTSKGTTNTVSSREGRGLEIDYLNKAGLDNHFPHYLGLIASQNKKSLGKSLKVFHADSWEGGPQTWTSNFAEEFERRRGYSMHPYYAVLTGGRMVDGLDQSERFLWDFRRTIADLIAENFWGYLTELCHAEGVLCSNEGSGYQQYMADPLLYLGKADMPMGEFWVGESDLRPDCHLASSVANIYGKTVVAGEAFTSTTVCSDPEAGRWMDHPYSLKAYGDRAFCIGINRFVFHRSVHQPQLNSYPGLAWSAIGINMERTNTWWKPGAAWIAYLNRCQRLLQTGTMVADIAVLVSEGVPNVLPPPESLPEGYRYDGLHTELLSKVTVKAGEMILPSGMRYRVLILSTGTSMTPHVAREIDRLLKTGAAIVGIKPTASPSLTDFPACDTTVKEIATHWSQLFATVQDALRALKLSPDFTSKSATSPGDVLYLHRYEGANDLYFVSNQTNRSLDLQMRFRISGRPPILFDPDSGEKVHTGQFRLEKDFTEVPTSLPPRGSVFVLFEGSTKRESVTESSRKIESFFLEDGSLRILSPEEGKLNLRSSHGRSATLDLSPLPTQPLKGPWSLTFPEKWGAPPSVMLDQLISWSDHPDEGVRHFAGTATYATEFVAKPVDPSNDLAIFLDLGEVEVIAEVKLNGRSLGNRWKPPFRYEITGLLKPSKNTLEVAITNLWPNRMIGDSMLPEERRFTQTNYNPYKPEDPLLKSGLLGPVSLVFCHHKTITWT